MTEQTKKTIQALKLKMADKGRMPSIKNIAKVLDELGIKYDIRESTNTVEYRSKGNRYVNSRHDGKSGMKLDLKHEDGTTTTLDSSDSYYSYNTWGYARILCKMIDSL